MKTKIALGVTMSLLLLLQVILHRASSGRHPASEGDAAAQSRRTSQSAPARFTAVHARRATPAVQSDCIALLAAVDEETDPERRSETLERAVESDSDSEPSAALDTLAHHASAGAAEMRLLLVRRWAERDAPAAAAWASQIPESPEYRAALEQVAIAWANTDLPAAANWVHALPEGDSKQVATLDLAYEAARAEPVAALELASTLPPTRTRDDLLVYAVSQWAGTDSATAAAWATKVSDPDLRQRLVGSVAVVLADQNAVAAATLAVTGLDAGDDQDRAVVSIVQRWVQNSPEAAASWVSQFPDIPLRDAAVQNLLALWNTRDVRAAGEWLRNLPAGSLRDSAIVANAQVLADRESNPPVVSADGGW